MRSLDAMGYMLMMYIHLSALLHSVSTFLLMISMVLVLSMAVSILMTLTGDLIYIKLLCLQAGKKIAEAKSWDIICKLKQEIFRVTC